MIETSDGDLICAYTVTNSVNSLRIIKITP